MACLQGIREDYRPPDARSTILDRNRLPAVVARIRRQTGRSPRSNAGLEAFLPRGLILQPAFLLSRFALAPAILTLTFCDAVHGLAAGLVAITSPAAKMRTHGLITPRPVAEKFRKILVAA
jgi:hypothetical protein